MLEDVRLLPYAPADRLWGREVFTLVGTVDPGWVLYRASGYEAECARHGFDTPYPPESAVKWRPSIHMPRWASRITMPVYRVRGIKRVRAPATGAVYGTPGMKCSYLLRWLKTGTTSCPS
ncbi:hypothetical protein [Roseospira marina]|uniref:hypothetical protein n=1 Tax=Roseospira marina TaxID=140057 RepID=UPI00147935C7|nr:hypothetical protein [Roseospira marina]MBB4312489.1 hypothetical protein [Roseospira marina]MBB5085495.1 hypothetical protein [Roseospira marina]